MLIGVALLLAIGALGLWLWENSDSQQNDRETEALTVALSDGGDYEQPEADASVPLVLAGISAVLFIGGVILVSPTRTRPGASDRQ